MTRPVRITKIRRAEDANYTDVSAYAERSGYRPPTPDLAGAIGDATVQLVDIDGALGLKAGEGLEVRLEDDLAAVVFGGWCADPIIDVPAPGVQRWTLNAQSWAARLAESSTGSLNKSGMLDSDRNFVIAMFRDALAAASMTFGVDNVGVDDPIIAANEAVGWSGVEATAFIYGADWSYRQLLDDVADLLQRIPGTSLRIRPDKIVEYGVLSIPATVALAAFTDASEMSASAMLMIDADSYQEEILVAGHYNKVRLGGLGVAESTAYDQVSFGTYGRVMNAPYVNDENIAAADIIRASYAKLASLAIRRVARARTTHSTDALEPGQLVPVLVRDLGCYADEGWSLPIGELYEGTPLQEPAAGYRGEMLVQKVSPVFVAPGVQSYDIELGAYLPDFDRALAASIGGVRVG